MEAPFLKQVNVKPHIVGVCYVNFLFLFFLPNFVNSFPSHTHHEEIVKVELLKRSTRSATSGNYDYEVLIRGLDNSEPKLLQLRSANSILSPSFVYNEVDVNERGETVFQDVTPAPRKLREIQKQIYIDAEENAAVRVQDGESGDIALDGYINGARIRRQNEVHVLQVVESTEISVTEGSDQPTEGQSDYVDLHRPMSQPRGMLLEKVLHASPELAVVIDYENSKLFNFDTTKILEYISIMLNSVNNRFSLNEDPKITVQLVGVHVIKSRAAQPFIEEAKNHTENTYNIFEINSGYGKWVFQNLKQLPKHDIAPLVFGAPLRSDITAIGIAPVSGACWHHVPGSNTSAATTVSHDMGGLFKGAATLAHELAHNLGALHDDDPGTESCKTSDGYMMSKKGSGSGGLNKFGLSKCSQNSIKKFSASSGGACLLMKAQGAKVVPPAKKQAGDIISIKKLCENYFKNPRASAMYQDNADESCRNVTCKLDDGLGIRTMRTYYPPGDNAPCGDGGVCLNGFCKGHRARFPPLTLDQLCVKITEKSNAYVRFEDPNVQCGNKGFNCRYEEGGRIYGVNSGSKAKDGTPCGESGKCRNATCAGQKTDPLTMDQLCVKITHHKNARVQFEDPDIQCSEVGFKCVYEIGGNVFLARSGFKPKVGTPCGNSGKCKNDTCKEQGPPLTMDQLCIKITNHKSALVQFEDPDLQCSKAGFKCVYEAGGKVQSARSGFKTRDGTPCGNSGKCLNGTCKEEGSPFTMNQLCIKITKKDNARVKFEDPNVQCGEKGFKCRYEMDGNIKTTGLSFKAKDGTPCGDSGKCGGGKCIGSKPMDMKKICELATGLPQSTPFERVELNEMCSKLSCRLLERKLFPIGVQTPNGTPCGNQGAVCQNGKCMNLKL